VLNGEGVVDYAEGPIAPGVFLVVTTDQPRLRECLVLRDMGPGPNYLLFRPFHLCSMEVPLSAALAVVHGRPSMTPKEQLVAEVFAVAKRGLDVGESLDGIGGRDFYSLIDLHETAAQERLLPAGLAKNARITRPVMQDVPITYEDVDLPATSPVVALRSLQDEWAAGRIGDTDLVSALESLAAGR
jgi:predicted homoserine dehydrogenase-like protein